MTYTIRYIGAAWCVTCKVIKPKIEELCKKFSLDLKICELEELDDNEANMISKVPTVKVIQDAKVIVSWNQNQLKNFEEWCATNIKLETTDF